MLLGSPPSRYRVALTAVMCPRQRLTIAQAVKVVTGFLKDQTSSWCYNDSNFSRPPATYIGNNAARLR